MTRPRRSDLILPLLLIAACVALTAPARASEEDARTLFAEGRRLRLQGDCRAAVDLFRRALAAFPEGLGALRNLAECQVELGQLASARRSYWDLRREALRSDASRYDGWEHDAEQAYGALDARVPRLTIEVKASDPARVQVTVDGEPLAAELMGVELERDPGAYRIEATGGVEVTREIVVLREGERKRVSLGVSVAPPADLGEPAPVASSGLGVATIAGIASLGVAGLAAAGIGISAAIRQDALGELEGLCPGYAHEGRCRVDGPAAQSEASKAIDRGKSAATAVNVLSAVAGAGAVTGATLLLVGLTGAELQPGTAMWLVPTEGGAVMGGGVRF